MTDIPPLAQAHPMPLEGQLDKPGLAHDLREAINRNSADAACDTSDFVLADYLVSCLKAFRDANKREKMLRAPLPEEK